MNVIKPGAALGLLKKDDLSRAPADGQPLTLSVQDLTSNFSGFGRTRGKSPEDLLRMAECFKDWKDWFRDRPAIQARWDARKERMRLERGTAQATGPARRQGRL